MHRNKINRCENNNKYVVKFFFKHIFDENIKTKKKKNLTKVWKIKKFKSKPLNDIIKLEKNNQKT